MRILLTGCAGFIGSHTLDRLLADGHQVIGVDNFDPFYSRALKIANIEAHLGGTTSVSSGSFEIIEADLAEPETYRKIKFLAEGLERVEGGDLKPESESAGSNKPTAKENNASNPTQVPGLPPSPFGTTGDRQDSGFRSHPSSLKKSHPSFDAIIHLAAKAGVRPSIEDPAGYQRANIIATQNLLEFAREQGIKQFVFASSSSVYGVNPRVPWREDDHVLQPISPYASTKVSCELMGHVYSHLYGIRFLGLRFFTVYGPRQRPDLAINKFVRLIEAGESIPVFGDGSTRRDYTYVDDIVEGIVSAVEKSVASGPPVQTKDNQPTTGEQPALRSLHDLRSLGVGGGEGGTTEEPRGTLPLYAVVNLGNDQTMTLSELIATIEDVVGKKAIIDRQPQQPGDVPQTWADVSKAKELLAYEPTTTFKEGVAAFYDWSKDQSSGFV